MSDQFTLVVNVFEKKGCGEVRLNVSTVPCTVIEEYQKLICNAISD